MRIVFVYAVLILILSKTVWINVDIFSIEYLWMELISIFTAISMLGYFIYLKDYQGLSIVIKFTIISIVITLVTSLFGLSTYPMAARELAGVLARDNMENLILQYKQIGIGGYGFFASIIFLVPILISEIKSKSNLKSKRFAFFFILLLCIYGLVQAKYIANILIALGVIVIASSGSQNFKKSLIIVVIFSIILLLLPLTFYTKTILLFANLSTGTFLHDRLLDLSYFISISSYTNTEIGLRADRVPLLLDTFINSPFWGGGEGNGHLHWLNKLAQFGLVGTIPLIYLLLKQLNDSLNKINDNYRFFFLVSVVSFFLLGSMKSLVGEQIFYMILFVIPGYYSNRSTEKQLQNNAQE